MGEALVSSRPSNGPWSSSTPIQILPNACSLVVTAKDSDSHPISNLIVKAQFNNEGGVTTTYNYVTNYRGQVYFLISAKDNKANITVTDYFSNKTRIVDQTPVSSTISLVNNTRINNTTVMQYRKNILLSSNENVCFIVSNYADVYVIGGGGSRGHSDHSSSTRGGAGGGGALNHSIGHQVQQFIPYNIILANNVYYDRQQVPKSGETSAAFGLSANGGGNGGPAMSVSWQSPEGWSVPYHVSGASGIGGIGTMRGGKGFGGYRVYDDYQDHINQSEQASYYSILPNVTGYDRNFINNIGRGGYEQQTDLPLVFGQGEDTIHTAVGSRGSGGGCVIINNMRK